MGVLSVDNAGLESVAAMVLKLEERDAGCAVLCCAMLCLVPQ